MIALILDIYLKVVLLLVIVTIITLIIAWKLENVRR